MAKATPFMYPWVVMDQVMTLPFTWQKKEVTRYKIWYPMIMGQTFFGCCPMAVKVKAARATPTVGPVNPAPWVKWITIFK